MIARRLLRAFLVALFLAVPLTASAGATSVPEPDSFATASRFDGSARAPVADLRAWRQAAFELRRRDARAYAIAHEASRIVADAGAEEIPIAVINASAPVRVFVAVALRQVTYRGADLRFTLDRDHWVGAMPTWLWLDAGDGSGFRLVHVGDRVPVHYATLGTKTVRLRAVSLPASVREATFLLRVEALHTPRPDDTLHVAATIPYAGATGSGRAYVYHGAGHARIERPAIVVEGFDLSNDQHADELYTLLDRQRLAGRVRARGYDLVVLDLADATDYLQRNAFVLVALIERIQAMVHPDTPLTVVGASTGGIIGRYGLAWMESQGVSHRVATFLTLDAPNGGANIPIGLQYWFRFFGDVAAEADFIVERLNRPAARQILLEHFRDRPTEGHGPDPLRGRLLADLDAVGGWPRRPRTVGIANGSGAGANQGFGPGALLLSYNERSFFRRIRGDVWAAPDRAPGVVFDGIVSILIPLKAQRVVVSGTDPLDGAPGGWRASMLQMDTTAVPYGDIVAVQPHHCFVPTVSALALDLPLTQDLRTVPDLAARSPYDAVCFPLENQEHVDLTAENAEWIEREVTSQHPVPSPVATREPWAPSAIALGPAVPNPAAGATRVAFRLPVAGRTRLTVHDLAGRRLETLLDRDLPAGDHEISWPGREHHALRPGVYWVTLEAGSVRRSLKVMRME